MKLSPVVAAIFGISMLGAALMPAPVRALDLHPVATGLGHSCALTGAGGVKCWGNDGYGQLGDGAVGPDRKTTADVVGLTSGVAQVAAGDFHTCALTSAGGVKCWGNDDRGQLGDGTVAGNGAEGGNRSVPADVVGLTSGVVQIALGEYHSCALLSTGGVKCWGTDESGELGDGTINTPDFRPTPIDVVGLASGVVAIAADGLHTCALTDAGGVKCWGNDGYGQLGDGTQGPDRPTAADVVGLTSGVAAIELGRQFSCAVMVAGGVKCWGLDNTGQLGDGDPETTRATPGDVLGLSGPVVAITAGGVNLEGHACALLSSGGLQCWGADERGQLGDGVILPNRGTVADVVGLSGVAAVSAGGAHTCAVTTAGDTYCWGWDEYGQLGPGVNQFTDSPTPILVPGDYTSITPTTQRQSLAAGRGHTCALTGAGGVKCWGNDGFGQLGDGTIGPDRITLADVVGLTSGVVAIAAGEWHTCALTGAGGVKCWGLDQNGQLGDGVLENPASRPTPADVVGLTSGVVAIAAGNYHTCALLDTGGVKCWGADESGELGDGTTANPDLRPTPADVVGLASGVAAIAADGLHTCAITSAGAMKCWGNDSYSQLGDGVEGPDRPTPLDVTGLTGGVIGMDLGREFSCALMGNGGVKCWGRNAEGQLGDSAILPSPDRALPDDVDGLSGPMVAISAGSRFACAINTAGGVECWGEDIEGQLGDGVTGPNRSVAAPVVGLGSGVAAISAGNAHACAATFAGEVYCWGWDEYGQLGPAVPQFSDSPTPIPVPGGFSSPTAGTGLTPAPLPPPPASAGAAGASVAVAPGVVVVGAPEAIFGGVASGEVYVYTGADLAPGKASAAAVFDAKVLAQAQLVDIDTAVLQLPSGVAGRKLGASVAVSRDGGTVVVGAPGESGDRGAVYVFKRPESGWGTNTVPAEQTLIPPLAAAGDLVGAAVALGNNGTLFIGAPGADVGPATDAGTVHVYLFTPGGYGFSESLVAPIAAPPQNGAHLGAAVAAEGADLLVGVPEYVLGVPVGLVLNYREPSPGQPYALRAIVTDASSAAGDRFGASLAISNGDLLIGVPGRDQASAVDAGEVRIAEMTPDGFGIAGKLVDPNAQAGAALGTVVAIKDRIVAAAAPQQDVNGNVDQGAVAIYVPPDPLAPYPITLAPTGYIYDPFGRAGDRFGSGFAFAAALAVAGAPFHDVAAPQAAKTLAAGGATGEAIAYVDGVVFRDGLESPFDSVEGCATPNAAITDNSAPGIVSNLTLSTAAGELTDLDVVVRINHPFVSDLRITLEHMPTSTVIELYTPAQDCPGDNLAATFDDSGTALAKSACGASPGVSGTVIPNQWLATMQGKTRAGPWRLNVADVKAGDAGTLVSWCLDARGGVFD